MPPTTRFFLAEHRGRRFLCAAHFPMRFAVLNDGKHPKLWIGEAFQFPAQATARRTMETVAVVPMREISPTQAREMGADASKNPRDFLAQFDRRYPQVGPQVRAA